MFLIYRKGDQFFSGKRIEIQADEYRHLRARRLAYIGNVESSKEKIIFVGDGISQRWHGKLDVESQHATVTLLGKTEEKEEPLRIIACSLPEKPRLHWLIEKSTELGMTHFIAIKCQYSNTPYPLEKPLIKRLNRIILSAATQSQRFFLPKILKPIDIDDLTGYIDKKFPTHTCQYYLCHPQDEQNQQPVIIEKNRHRAICFIIGAEGGFSAKELVRLKKFQRLKLADHILRVETAAIAALASVATSDCRQSPHV